MSSRRVCEVEESCFYCMPTQAQGGEREQGRGHRRVSSCLKLDFKNRCCDSLTNELDVSPKRCEKSGSYYNMFVKGFVDLNCLSFHVNVMDGNDSSP